MVGFIFGFTQYLQFVQGHTPLAAEIRFLPAAGGLMLGAIASEELVRRFGTTRVVATGLVIMPATMPLVLLSEMNTSYLVGRACCGHVRAGRRSGFRSGSRSGHGRG